MKHLYSNRCHDESEVWCDSPDYYRDGEPTWNPEHTTCVACLSAAGEFGKRAAMRYLDLDESEIAWAVGDKAKWVGKLPGLKAATWNPPPPGWVPPTHEEMEFSRRMYRNLRVEVVGVDGGKVMVRADDGFTFDAGECIEFLVPHTYAGWEQPWVVDELREWKKRTP